MSDEEKELRNWKTLPARSSEAFAAARTRAEASGQPLVRSENGVIREVSPDGASRIIKRVDPPVRVTKGKIITLRG